MFSIVFYAQLYALFWFQQQYKRKNQIEIQREGVSVLSGFLQCSLWQLTARGAALNVVVTKETLIEFCWLFALVAAIVNCFHYLFMLFSPSFISKNWLLYYVFENIECASYIYSFAFYASHVSIYCRRLIKHSRLQWTGSAC